MNRLTFEGLFCDIAQCVGQPGNTSECPGGYCDQRRTWERLKEYEDTGLTPEQVANQRWIPVSERLPESEVRVLTIRADGAIEIECIFADVEWAFGNGPMDEVTHWMPLPESPKEITS